MHIPNYGNPVAFVNHDMTMQNLCVYLAITSRCPIAKKIPHPTTCDCIHVCNYYWLSPARVHWCCFVNLD